MFQQEFVPIALQQLHQALDNHERWTRELIRTLACGLPPDTHDLAGDAYRHCRFGQWYYGSPEPHLRTHAGFAAVEQQHRMMHELAARLLTTAERGQPVRPHDYDAFASALDLLRLQLSSLVRELEGQLHDFDPLTGAETRIRMLPALREMLELVTRGNMSCCIALLDLDHFKHVNDEHGHVIGDEVLAGTVVAIREGIRAYDKLFRYGGEEFLLAMPHATIDAAMEIAERARARLAEAMVAPKVPTLRVTASFGLTGLTTLVPVEESIARADAALYAAKRAGRNRVVVWQEGVGAPGT